MFIAENKSQNPKNLENKSFIRLFVLLFNADRRKQSRQNE